MEQSKYSLLILAENHIAEYFKENISAEYVYHDLQHTQNVVRACEEVGAGFNLSEEEMEILKLAAWFHDSGYDQGPKNHEERSCKMAESFLRQHQYPESRIRIICDCIMATKVPQKPETLLQRVLCDADLCHLGKKIYWDRCGRLRQELLLTQNRVMSEQEWVDFELDFMVNHRYHTFPAQKLYARRKEKYIRQLIKQKLRLNPEEVITVDEMVKREKKKKKSTSRKSNLTYPDNDFDLKQLRLGRGVETMYRTTYRTHVNLSSIADNKANIMLSINAIIISIILTSLVPQFEDNTQVILPTLILLLVCLSAMVFAILSTRPKITEGKFSREDIEQKRSNLLFFGNFYNMKLDDFHWGMMEMIKDSDFLYSSMTRDLYFLGVVLAKKYRYLRMCYGIFMYGLIISVLAFALAFLR